LSPPPPLLAPNPEVEPAWEDDALPVLLEPEEDEALPLT